MPSFQPLSISLPADSPLSSIALSLTPFTVCGCSMLVFPGHSHRVAGEIEREFSKYSVRVLDMACTTIMELATAISTLPSAGGSTTKSTAAAYAEVNSLWKVVRTFRNRVLGVYFEVLSNLFDESGTISPPPPPMAGSATGTDTATSGGSGGEHFTAFGNNLLMGDIGDLSSVSVRPHSCFRCSVHVSASRTESFLEITTNSHSSYTFYPYDSSPRIGICISHKPYLVGVPLCGRSVGFYRLSTRSNKKQVRFWEPKGGLYLNQSTMTYDSWSRPSRSLP